MEVRGSTVALSPNLPVPPLSPLQAALGDAPSPWEEGWQALRPPVGVCQVTDLRDQKRERAQLPHPDGKGGARPHQGPALPLPRPLPSWEMLSTRAHPLPILSTSGPEPGLLGKEDQLLGPGL